MTGDRGAAPRDRAVPANPARVRFIVNPISGASRGRGFAGVAAAAIRRGTFDYDVVTTAEPGDGEALARQAVAAGCDLVVAVGGDGTVNEVARGLLGQQASALGIVPCGSGNGLARHLGVPLRPERAVRALVNAETRFIDVGHINERPFFCTAGLGFDAHVSRAFAGAGRRGLRTYVAVTLREFRAYRPTPARIEVNGQAIDTDCYVLAFANAAQYGNNAYIAPLADVQDGLLDLCLIDALPLRRALRVSYALAVGDLPTSGAAEFHTARDVRVNTARPIGFHVDGDYAGEAEEFIVGLTPLALKVAV